MGFIDFVDQVFKLRASHTKERQIWVDRLRACAHRHNLVRRVMKKIVLIIFTNGN